MDATVKRVVALLAWLAPACAATGSAHDWSAVRAELAQRVERDQELRRQLVSGATIDPALLEQLSAVDRDNTEWMKDLVERHGWPTVASVGDGGAGHAWLLVQHADRDVDFQEQCLLLLREAAAQGQASPTNLAYLEDRVAMHRGRPQRYGTQFVRKDGRMQPYELEDPTRVDAWRAEVGLGSLAEYTKLIEGR